MNGDAILYTPIPSIVYIQGKGGNRCELMVPQCVPSQHWRRGGWVGVRGGGCVGLKFSNIFFVQVSLPSVIAWVFINNKENVETYDMGDRF